MKKRTLGKNGPDVSEIGFGCMGLSYGYGPSLPKDEAIKVTRSSHQEHACDGSGSRFKNTAPIILTG